ncbi:uracil-DNA glycosylase [Aeromonas veronii]|uniref:uracil-DNA glycosylase n=1 Tax=Aeromonas veronii TaxID=654 RepID=UPI001F20377B|nr:uracil-DNA glycosylase [Aeromonas veronii]MCF5848156.1 uracil-DNA glycosylase [Aeromonas veronii]
MKNWSDALGPEKEQPYFKECWNKVKSERAEGKTIYPSQSDICNAFKLTELSDVKVVILGQDPYFNPGEAHGLSFSVPHGVTLPSSLENIYQELASDILGFQKPTNGNLESWARQGVLLLNTVLTVEQGKPNSHKDYGWVTFTDKAISEVNEHCEGVVFLLWGKKAQEKESLINKQSHKILKTSHPSGKSAENGFLGCKHFSKTNDFLISQNKTPIDWTSVCR